MFSKKDSWQCNDHVNSSYFDGNATDMTQMLSFYNMIIKISESKYNNVEEEKWKENSLARHTIQSPHLQSKNQKRSNLYPKSIVKIKTLIK